MKRHMPDIVLQAGAHAFLVVPGDSTVEFYVREDEFSIARYPQRCSLEFSLPVWDDGSVMCIALLVQLAGRNASTFDHWINAADPEQLRILQLLGGQKALDLYLVSDRVLRSMRCRNSLAGAASGLIATLRVRKAWAKQQFEERRKRLDTLYPTSDRLWRAARELGK